MVDTQIPNLIPARQRHVEGPLPPSVNYMCDTDIHVVAAEEIVETSLCSGADVVMVDSEIQSAEVQSSTVAPQKEEESYQQNSGQYTSHGLNLIGRGIPLQSIKQDPRVSSTSSPPSPSESHTIMIQRQSSTDSYMSGMTSLASMAEHSLSPSSNASVEIDMSPSRDQSSSPSEFVCNDNHNV